MIRGRPTPMGLDGVSSVLNHAAASLLQLSTNVNAALLWELFTLLRRPAYQAFLADQGVNPVSRFKYCRLSGPTTFNQEIICCGTPSGAVWAVAGLRHDCSLIPAPGKPSFGPVPSPIVSGATRFEQVFYDGFSGRDPPLWRSSASPGTWVGGMYTANCCRHLAGKGYPAASLAIKRDIAGRAGAGPAFDQVVLGYPPFLKMLIDQGIHGALVAAVCDQAGSCWRSL